MFANVNLAGQVRNLVFERLEGGAMQNWFGLDISDSFGSSTLQSTQTFIEGCSASSASSASSTSSSTTRHDSNTDLDSRENALHAGLVSLIGSQIASALGYLKHQVRA